MRRISVSIFLALVLSLAAVGSALGHVHAVTPLNDACSADGPPNNNDNAGGNGTNGTPADNDRGGPIGGVIPNDATPEGTPAEDKPGEAGKHSSLCD